MPVVLVVLGPKGGAGKSTLIRNLAVAAACDGMAVTAIDTDPQGTLDRWGERRRRGDHSPPIDVRRADLDGARDALKGLSADFILVDTPTAIEEHPVAVKSLILAASLVLIPARPSLDDVDSVEPFAQVVQDLRRPAAFVLNGVRPRVRETEGARRRLGHSGDVLAAALPDSVDVQRAMADGRGIAEMGGRGAEEMAALWAEVRRRVAPQRGAA